MLNFILGKSGSGKTEYIKNLLTGLRDGGKLMVIVPEQYSFNTEKMMLEAFGAKNAASIEVMTFSRLYDFVMRTQGGFPGRRLTDSGRSVLMSLAVEAASDSLSVYSKQSMRPDFAGVMLSAADEFKRCGVTPEMLREKADLLDDTQLSNKLKETALIAEAYDALLNISYQDPQDDLIRLANKLAACEIFKSYTVFADAFSGFTKSELDVLTEIIKQCKDIYFAFTSDSCPQDDEDSLFYTVGKTIKSLKRIARSYSVRVADYVYLSPVKRAEGQGIRYLAENLFDPSAPPHEGEVFDVELYAAGSACDEAAYAAMRIRKAVIEDGASYSDFAIVTRSYDKYSGVISSALESSGIPYFSDFAQDIASKPIIRLVVSAFEAALSGLQPQDILKMLKSGLTVLNADDTAMLENYIFTWSINGSAFSKPFTQNPRGFTDETTENDIKELEALNTLRVRIYEPLSEFSNALKSRSGEEISKAIYSLLEKLCVRENIKELCEKLRNSAQYNLADEQLRLWDMLMDILDEAVVLLKGKKISADRFLGLLKLQINSCELSFIPQSLDEVCVGTADRIRLFDVKTVFVLGANEGEFPHTPVSSGIFSDSERVMLICNDLPLYDGILGLSAFEKYLAYSVLSSPSSKLIVTYCETDLKGEKYEPSIIVREISRLLPGAVRHERLSLSLRDTLYAEKPAFEALASVFCSGTPESASLKELFKNREGYEYKISAIERIIKSEAFKLKDKACAARLFKGSKKLSPSNIESFYLCKFQYFCKYGLRLKERRKAQIDPLEYGTIVHYLFEQVLKSFDPNEILAMGKDALTEKVTELLKDYIERVMGGAENKSARFLSLFYKTAKTAAKVLLHMARELSQSRFMPADFELKIGADIAPYTVKLPNGEAVYVNGKIDRVDVMKQDGVPFIRIIDYKTNAKQFKLSDVLYGLNMQMLIYLSAISQNGSARYGDGIVPAGILYMPAAPGAINAYTKMESNDVQREASKHLKMNGLILDDEAVINGMEPGAAGLFIPVGKKKNGTLSGVDSLLKLEHMGKLFKKIDMQIAQMAECLKSGDIEALPVKSADENGYDSCRWCGYSGICGIDENKKGKELLKLDTGEVIRELLNAKDGDEVAD